MPSIYAAFALLVAITAQFTVVMWIMVFAAAIRLRFKKLMNIEFFMLVREVLTGCW